MCKHACIFETKVQTVIYKAPWGNCLQSVYKALYTWSAVHELVLTVTEHSLEGKWLEKEFKKENLSRKYHLWSVYISLIQIKALAIIILQARRAIRKSLDLYLQPPCPAQHCPLWTLCMHEIVSGLFVCFVLCLQPLIGWTSGEDMSNSCPRPYLIPSSVWVLVNFDFTLIKGQICWGI